MVKSRPPHILLGAGGVAHRIGMAAVGVCAVGAEGRHLRHCILFLIAIGHKNHAEVRSNGKGAREELQHHIRRCARCYVVVVWLAAQQQVSHAPAAR